MSSPSLTPTSSNDYAFIWAWRPGEYSLLHMGIGASSIHELTLAQFVFLVTTSLSLFRLSEHMQTDRDGYAW